MSDTQRTTFDDLEKEYAAILDRELVYDLQDFYYNHNVERIWPEEQLAREED